MKPKILRAVVSKNANLLNEALDDGENPNQKYNGNPLLELAIRSGCRKNVELLLKYGAKVSQRHKNLLIACNKPELVSLLIEAGADPDFCPKSSFNIAPIHYFATNGSHALVKELLNHGANPNLLDERRDTALIKASYYGKYEVVRVLVGFGAKYDIRGENGNTALHSAASLHGLSGPKILDFLLRSGAKVDNANDRGITPLMHAARSRSIANVRLLLHSGADINRKSKTGHTPLLWAILEEDVKIAQMLLKNGAETNSFVSKKDMNKRLAGKSLMEIASRSDSKKMRELFRKMH